MRPSYVPLRNHTAYSLLEGACHVDTLVTAAKARGVPALGLSDTRHLFGALEFSLACQKCGIQPIIGCVFSLVLEEESGLGPCDLVLYAKTEEGYRNLCALVTRSTVGQSAALKECITWTQLSAHTQGLMVLSGGPRGPINQLLLRSQNECAKAWLKKFCATFPEHFYVELSRYGDPEHARIEDTLVMDAFAEGIPVIATNEAFFLTPDGYEAYDTLRCIANSEYVQDPKRIPACQELFFKTTEEMERLFSDIPEALENTVRFAEKCQFLLKKRHPELPEYPCACSDNELKKQSHAGLLARLGANVSAEVRTRYEDRLFYECDVIAGMGFSGYFLIVSDFVRWAKEHQIPVGPGRGSGASALVAWSLQITDVDPLRFNLLFERFLNPERVSMPDFDIDFCQDRREEVIAYVRARYGEDRVAQIITFGSLQARAVLRDVGRVLQMPYMQVDRICKLIPHQPAAPVSLAEAVKKDAQLVEMINEDEQVASLFRIGKKLEGLYRHASTHAAGVVIGRDPLVTYVPLYKEDSATLPATEFSLKYIEDAGLVKFDFLGLKVLSILSRAVKLLKDRDIQVDLPTIPLDDVKTFNMLKRVETVGVFQLETTGMSDVLRQLQPDRFEEIIALVALYRPGPMEDIPRYIACRHGREKVQYPYPCLEDILKETFGVMVYQEQVLQIARTLAGYSLGNADLLRRAMGKKIKEEMAAQRSFFVKGVLDHHGGSAAEASQLFDQIAKFAGYAFPKAHATPYALISYQTAYMKANYPVEFMAAVMSYDLHHTDKLYVFVRELKRMGIMLLPPDINASHSSFTVEQCPDGRLGIRYALAALKNVGSAATEKIVAEREIGGPFRDIYGVFERIDATVLNKKSLEGLIAAGVFDRFIPNRHQLMQSVDMLLHHAAAETRNTLFSIDDTRPKLADVPAWSMQEQLSQEFLAMGFYASAHPLDPHVPLFSGLVLSSSVSAAVSEKKDGVCFSMLGIVVEVRRKTGKADKPFAFVQLSDPGGPYELIVFSDLLMKNASLLTGGAQLFFRVRGRINGDAVRLVAEDMLPLDEALKREPVHIPIETEAQLMRLHQQLQDTPSGDTSIILRFPSRDGRQALGLLPDRYEISLETRTSLIQ